eukprot:1063781-Ditylum_brightwellii.AAC.1
MMTMIYPSAPKSNVALVSIIFILHTSKGGKEQSTQYYVLFSTIVLFSACIDIDWLSSDYYAVPLNPSDDTIMFMQMQELSIARLCAWFGVLANVLLKLGWGFTTTRLTKSGRNYIPDFGTSFMCFVHQHLIDSPKILKQQ